MRPEGLPDFEDPPLIEVALGVQFTTPKGFKQIRSGEIWSLFRERFPIVQEMPPLPPTFETFGAPGGLRLDFGLIAGMPQPRYWFLTSAGDELIQFQPDRLHHNWRKVGDHSNSYPRFERMLEDFRGELDAAESYFASLADQTLTVSQCEITYVNQVPIDMSTGPSPDEYLKLLSLGELSPEDFRLVLRRVMRDDSRSPIGRIICEASVAQSGQGTPVINLNLTARGAPKTPTIASAIEFLKRGRAEVVTLFAAVTTETAHKLWKRIQ